MPDHALAISLANVKKFFDKSTSCFTEEHASFALTDARMMARAPNMGGRWRVSSLGRLPGRRRSSGEEGLDGRGNSNLEP